MTPTESELRELDARVKQALESGDEHGLVVLGYGEISTVLALETPRGRCAAKRMPLFSASSSVDAYRSLVGDYVAALEAAGVRVVPTDVMSLSESANAIGVYVVQPVLDASSLLPKRLAGAGEDVARELFEQLIEATARVVSDRVGLDAQISNWVWSDGTLAYLDVSTPLLRDADGRERLDTHLFLRSLPWLLRPVVRRFALGAILDKYYALRGALLDIAGNLQKEGVERHLDAFLELANRRVEPPLTEREVRAYYASDARMWALLQRLRRADRRWQRMFGRTYPFLLPGEIERRAT